MRLRLIVISGLYGSTTFLCIFSQTARFSGGGVVGHEMCVLIWYSKFVCNISHSKRLDKDMIINVYWSLCKVTVIVVYFNGNCTFTTHCRTLTGLWNLMKIRSVGDQLFHADGRTDRETDGRTERQTDGQTETDGWTDRRKTKRQTDRQRDRRVEGRTDRDRPTDRQTDGQTER